MPVTKTGSWLSYVQNHEVMKNATALLGLLLTTALHAQSDTLRTDSTARTNHHELQLMATPTGMKVQVRDTNDPDNDDGKDTIVLELKHKTIRIISTRKLSSVLSANKEEDLRDARRKRRNVFTYWSGLELGINTFIAGDGRIGDGPKAGPFLLNSLRSRWFAINFMEQKYEFGSHKAGFFWGLGLEFTGYHLSENVRLNYNSDSTWAVPVTDVDFTKNKLRQIGLRLPLMFEFNTKRADLPTTDEEWNKYRKCDGCFTRKGNIHVAVGVVGSWYFDYMYKQKFERDGEDMKVRDNGTYNFLPYRVAARAQIGVGGLNLFAEYGLTPIFKEGTAPKLTPLNIGLTIVGFN